MIGELMCQFALDTDRFAQVHDIDFKTYFKVELAVLKGLEEGGLLEGINQNALASTNKGHIGCHNRH